MPLHQEIGFGMPLRQVIFVGIGNWASMVDSMAVPATLPDWANRIRLQEPFCVDIAAAFAQVLLCSRQLDNKGRARPLFALKLDIAIVSHHDAFTDR
jgi:hypothetical protein